jgi:hypothetical protein
LLPDEDGDWKLFRFSYRLHWPWVDCPSVTFSVQSSYAPFKNCVKLHWPCLGDLSCIRFLELFWWSCSELVIFYSSRSILVVFSNRIVCFPLSDLKVWDVLVSNLILMCWIGVFLLFQTITGIFSAWKTMPWSLRVMCVLLFRTIWPMHRSCITRHESAVTCVHSNFVVYSNFILHIILLCARNLYSAVYITGRVEMFTCPGIT